MGGRTRLSDETVIGFALKRSRMRVFSETLTKKLNRIIGLAFDHYPSETPYAIVQAYKKRTFSMRLRT